MTVSLIDGEQSFIGLSSDTKPNPAVGSTFYESDTRLTYVFNATAWTLVTEAVGGAVAAGATDSGNPVKIGGKYNATQPTLTDGQRGDVQLTSRGGLRVELAQGANLGTWIVGGPTDGYTNSFTAMVVANNPSLFNGTTWDRMRGNTTVTGLASAARVATTATSDQVNYNGLGAQIMLDVTATPNDAQTLTVTVEVKDSVSGKYVILASFTALTASALGAAPTTETYVYSIYPGAVETIATAKHELQALLLGRTWRANIVHSAAGSWTYSVGIVNE